ncbi:MAG: glutamine synthetase [Gammaproteobacteria bacterium]|nr:MAG: glutamine synthetase [Gammaproteobacteria bacterium]
MHEDINHWLTARGITEVEGLVPDIAGTPRGKIVPARKFCKEDGMRLPESLFKQTVTGDYAEVGDDIEHDMVCRPDPATIRLVPWATDPTAQCIHDCFHHGGAPVETSPRYVLRRVLALYEAEGWKPVVAPEVEFFLVKRNLDPDYELEPPIGRSGRPETVRQTFSIDAVNEFDPLFEEMYDFCEAQELDLDTLIHEGGAAQMEVNFVHGDALDLADQVFLFKRTLRETAHRHEIYCTFMAKPMQGEPGSALHIHQSIEDLEGRRNLFAARNGRDSRLFKHHIGGLQRYLPEAIALVAPYVNSYRRFTRYYASPINVHWGYDNRTVGLRVPMSESRDRRVENRIAGADVNPYLAIATSLACGYLGMKDKIKPTPPLDEDAYTKPFVLPRELFAALARLKRCEPLIEILGEKFVEMFCGVKESEYETFFQVISPWEREYLLLNV